MMLIAKVVFSVVLFGFALLSYRWIRKKVKQKEITRVADKQAKAPLHAGDAEDLANQIANFENRNKVELPADYKSFLLIDQKRENKNDWFLRSPNQWDSIAWFWFFSEGVSYYENQNGQFEKERLTWAAEVVGLEESFQNPDDFFCIASANGGGAIMLGLRGAHENKLYFVHFDQLDFLCEGFQRFLDSLKADYDE